MNANNQLVVVLGMHRSGTSAITRGLQVLGADFGTNLQEGIAGVNEKGFFEDKDIVKLNTDILLALSRKWDSLAPISGEKLRGDLLDGLRPLVASLLHAKMRSGKVFAIKDPRMAQLLPFWQNVFDDMGIDASYVIAIRNPLSVANSLFARDNFAKEKSCYLWLEHVLPSITETNGKRRIVVDYDRLMEQPGLEIARIADALGLGGKLDREELAAYEGEFLDGNLRHVTFDICALKSDPAVPAVLADLYQALLRVAADELPLEAVEVLDYLHQALDHLKEASPALHYTSRQDAQIADLTQALAERNAQIADLEQRIGRVLGLFFDALGGGLNPMDTSSVLAAHQEGRDGPANVPATRPINGASAPSTSKQALDPAQLVQTFNALAKALAQAPDEPDVLIQLGTLALAANSPRDAYDYFRAAASKSPSGRMKVHGLGSQFVSEGNLEEGLIVLEAVLQSALSAKLQ